MVLALLIFLDGQGLVFWYFTAMILHEVGHFLTIICVGGGVKRVRLTAVGAEMQLDMTRPLSYSKEMLAIIAGPMVSFCVGLGAKQLGWYMFAGVNLSFGLINLLPVSNLDGGRFMHCILCMKYPNRAEEVSYWVSAVFSGVLLGLGLIAWIKWGNMPLLLAAGWLTIALLKN